MSFHITDEQMASFHRDGYTVLRSVLPWTLLKDLRAAAEAGRQIALRKTEMHGEQVLTPLESYVDQLDLKPFEDYVEYPPFVDAMHRLLDPGIRMSVDRMGILYEPRSEAMCTHWHRDIPEPVGRWDPFLRQMTMNHKAFNCRINCALYADASTSIVPGSHCREETESERKVTSGFPDFDAVFRSGKVTSMDAVEKELACIAYCRSMPGAVQIALEPGDIVLYPFYALHFAHRAPYRKRATLHHEAQSDLKTAWIKDHVERRPAALAVQA